MPSELLTTIKDQIVKLIPAAASLFIFLLILTLSSIFLIAEKLSGTEFVALIIFFALISLAIFHLKDIQELSIGGNIIKMREIEREAEQHLNEIKAIQSQIFEVEIDLALRSPTSGFGDNKIDGRIDNLIKVKSKIMKAGPASPKVIEALKIATSFVAQAQLNKLKGFLLTQIDRNSPLLAPEELFPHLDKSGDAKASFEAYKKIYEAYLEVSQHY